MARKRQSTWARFRGAGQPLNLTLEPGAYVESMFGLASRTC